MKLPTNSQIENEAHQELERLAKRQGNPAFGDYKSFIKEKAEYFAGSRKRNLMILCKNILVTDMQLFTLYQQARTYGWHELADLRTVSAFAQSLSNTVRTADENDLKRLPPDFFEDIMKLGELLDLLAS